ncbi:hypothetical protein DUT91_23570 [Phyllobacterium salinisoli]|uniref:Uncharacterized protein n=1 Tax=Phyllobacterium salinisoli TaxID=1899321 RepID=A0A368JWG9_9HYPH|nr:hypothetical protein DUT91_23570 [Phyllobacterium salinisoli]
MCRRANKYVRVKSSRRRNAFAGIQRTLEFTPLTSTARFSGPLYHLTFGRLVLFRLSVFPKLEIFLIVAVPVSHCETERFKFSVKAMKRLLLVFANVVFLSVRGAGELKFPLANRASSSARICRS